jgi:predicted SAM-dependent methyltransferase
LSEDVLNLHIGGKERHDGWKILNIQAGPHVDYVGDLRNLSQFSEGSVNRIYASHVLEHVAQREIVDVLKGIHRVLRPRGEFLVSVPDMDILCHLFINPVLPAEARWQVMRMLFGGQVDDNDFHYIGLNQQFLESFLRKAGFISMRRVISFGLFQDTSDHKPFGYPISLNMVALK